jgi:cardiolipin synthase
MSELMPGLEPALPPTPTIDTGTHRLRLLPDMRQLLDTFFADVAQARERVDVECYIVNSDVLGRMLGEALVGAVQRGVKVRLLFDPLGSEKADPAFFDELRARGVAVRAYRGSNRLLGKGNALTHDHGRIMLIDGVAYTGGAAWGDQWLPAEAGGKGWHDVCHRVQGPVVDAFAELFERRWAEATGEFTPCNFDTQDAYPDVRLLADTPDSVNVVEPAHREAIDGAKRRVWIANAYFYASRLLEASLCAAAARGVDVRLISVDDTDLPLIKGAARNRYRTWLERGILIYEYQPTVMHSKYLLVDDAWCSIGTWNANPTSTGLVNEINMICTHPAFVAEVAAQFERDLANSRQVTLEMTGQRSLTTRVADAARAAFLRAIDLTVGETHQDRHRRGDK